jgi:type VI protein secretion system component VasF
VSAQELVAQAKELLTEALAVQDYTSDGSVEELHRRIREWIRLVDVKE